MFMLFAVTVALLRAFPLNERILLPVGPRLSVTATEQANRRSRKGTARTPSCLRAAHILPAHGRPSAADRLQLPFNICAALCRAPRHEIVHLFQAGGLERRWLVRRCGLEKDLMRAVCGGQGASFAPVFIV